MAGSGSGTLDERVSFLELMSKMLTSAESCNELARNGIETSAYYHLDFDGKGVGKPPVKAMCKFPEIVTKVGGIEPVEVVNCQGVGCFEYTVPYEASMEQMVSLLQTSSTCTQEIRFDCFSSPLQVGTDAHNIIRLSYSIDI